MVYCSISPLYLQVQAAFADNEAIVACNDDPMLAYREDQRAINKAVQWMEAQCLEFSAGKSQAMFMTTKLKYILPPPKLRLYGEEIPYVDQVKYLGVTIDRTLLWDQQIKEKKQHRKGADGIVQGPGSCLGAKAQILTLDVDLSAQAADHIRGICLGQCSSQKD